MATAPTAFYGLWALNVISKTGGNAMQDNGQSGVIGRIRNYSRMLGRMEIPTHASHACYFIVLAVFPVLTLVLGLLRYTPLEAADLMGLVAGFLPDALEPYIWKLISGTFDNTSKAVVSLSAVTALWSASRGIFGLLQGLNAVYDVWENRGWLYTRGISVVYTFLFGLVLLLTLVLHVFGNTILGWLSMVDNGVVIFLLDLIDLRFFLLLILQSLIFTLMFMVLPNQRNRFVDSLPGGILASTGWLVFSDIFSIYVENFNSYSNIYGSVYAVALGMLWLYCCLSILFYGGALNHFLNGQE